MSRRARRIPRKPFVITLAVGLTACGGEVFDRESGGNAGGGAGGTSGAGGSSGTGGTPGCPTELPVYGTTCAGSLACEYPFCGAGRQTASCVSGTWQIMPHGSCNPPAPPVVCPAALPQANAPCDVRAEGMACDYPAKPCCPPETATCLMGFWRVPTIDCNPPPPVCPVNPPTSGTPCANDPCAQAPTECSYGDCSQGSRLIARCDGAAWRIEPTACPGQPCAGLDFCACFARTDCKYLSDSCICPCDYHCPGQPDCVCACGGGNYLGCAPR